MAEIGKTEVLALAQQGFLHFVDAHKFHPAFHLFVAHRFHLQCLHKVVAEEVVEATLNVAKFLLSLFGEAVGQLGPYQFPPIAHQIIDQREKQVVGQEIVDAERHSREQPQQSK